MSIFLCHSFHDKPTIRQLYQKLIRDGFDVWLDEERILPGQDWEREIAHAVRNADAVIVCLSHSAVTKSGYFQKEIKMVLDVADEKPERALFPIPARLEECKVPERVARYQWADLYEPGGYEKLIKSLRFAASKKEDANNIATDTNTKVEMGIVNPAFESDQTRQPQQVTVVLRSTGYPERDRRRIKTIYSTLISFQGKDRFSFQIYENGKGHLVDFPNDTTRVSVELLDRLKKLMGEQSWRVEEVQFK